ncbi:putative hydrolase of the HAD superfamily [Sporomusaceae bacterium BoRhaA]|uniref:HAD family hydrolase n=1 Tax=Pelorhabdus rhamnosifermentans TaxID=2772457 RepID=UPI001C062204|nr:HAD family hydrolase [Pelorhabdus rhamnosifermentans]MBU2699191.1 putative hydrolase of the HAD superfamily [Pelorhabdus rhamnosifermentans]
MIFVFDLDDTLYDEKTFVYSGFRAVARFLLETYAIPENDSYSLMIDRLKHGRGRIFDDTLLPFGVYSKRVVLQCLGVYRGHHPKIELYADAIRCMERLKKDSVYIVTDGNKLVQKNKLVALGLYNTVKFCFITHRYGVQHAKPSPHCFLKICEREKVVPSEVVYIGDNPYKDFVGIKALGFKTVRMMRGHFKSIVKPGEFEAHIQIQSLDELTEELLQDLSKISYQ